jgi:hypothetical protein
MSDDFAMGTTGERFIVTMERTERETLTVGAAFIDVMTGFAMASVGFTVNDSDAEVFAGAFGMRGATTTEGAVIGAIGAISIIAVADTIDFSPIGFAVERTTGVDGEMRAEAKSRDREGAMLPAEGLFTTADVVVSGFARFATTLFFLVSPPGLST